MQHVIAPASDVHAKRATYHVRRVPHCVALGIGVACVGAWMGYAVRSPGLMPAPWLAAISVWCAALLAVASPRARTRAMSVALVSVMALVIGAFYLATVRAGQSWAGDFSLYIRHAQNISTGLPYADTGHILNPYQLWGPPVYPPIFPLLLSVVYTLCGLNLIAMKVETVLLFFCAAFVIYRIAKHQWAFRDAPLLIAIVALNPYVWDFKDQILSEFPFMFFMYLSLWLTHAVYQSTPAGQRQTRAAVAIGLSCAVAYGTRNAGIMLLPAIGIYDLIAFRKMRVFPWKVMAVFIGCVLAQQLIMGTSGNYSHEIPISPWGSWLNVVYYITLGPFKFWDNGYFPLVTTMLLYVLHVAALVGWVQRVRTACSVYDLFFVLYLALLVAWASHAGPRFLLPVIPLYLYYALSGVACIAQNCFKRGGRVAVLVTAAVLLASYTGKYSTVRWGPMVDGGIDKPEAVQLFDYINTQTRATDRFVFIRPRVLALFTGREASVYHRPPHDEHLWDYFRSIDATYLIANPEMDHEHLSGIIERNHERLHRVYANHDFTVYRISK